MAVEALGTEFARNSQTAAVMKESYYLLSPVAVIELKKKLETTELNPAEVKEIKKRLEKAEEFNKRLFCNV